jgi:hypothetical protein
VAGRVAGRSVASGAGVVSGLLGWMVWVMAFLRGMPGDADQKPPRCGLTTL